MSIQQQMFRDCSYDVYYETEFGCNCRNCPQYSNCVLMRYRYNENMRKRAKSWNAFRIRIVAVLSIVVIATASVTVMAHNGNNDNTTQVSEVVYTPLRYDEPNYVMTQNVIFESEKETVSEETIPIVIEPRISAECPGTLYYYDLNESEKLYLAKMVYKEARGESFEGKVAVAAVALNRYASNDSRFDRRSIYSVVTQNGQFASITNVTQSMLDSNPECMKAVEAACKGWDPTRETFPETGALFFYSPKNMSAEAMLSRTGVRTQVIENHNFHLEFNPDYAP